MGIVKVPLTALLCNLVIFQIVSLTWSDACLWFAEDVIDRVDHGRQQHEGARPHQPHRDVGGGGGERGLKREHMIYISQSLPWY